MTYSSSAHPTFPQGHAAAGPDPPHHRAPRHPGGVRDPEPLPLRGRPGEVPPAALEGGREALDRRCGRCV